MGGDEAMMIPFLPEWKEAMLSGRKTCTCRSKKYGEVGDQFTIFGATFELVSVEKKSLEQVRDEYWYQEGCDSRAGFEQVWERIHPDRGFVPSDKRWLHQFVKVRP